jgi:hypothetical protein
MSIGSFYVDFQSSSTWSTPKGSFCGTSSIWNQYQKTSRSIILEKRRLNIGSIIETEINNFPIDSQDTSATQRSINTALEPFPVISGLGAENFKEELETMEYPENIKSFYKNSKELVRNLGLFP